MVNMALPSLPAVTRVMMSPSYSANCLVGEKVFPASIRLPKGLKTVWDSLPVPAAGMQPQHVRGEDDLGQARGQQVRSCVAGDCGEGVGGCVQLPLLRHAGARKTKDQVGTGA